ncbi:MAG: DUF1345 domain-containing protein [Propioniciclava sp.]|nr:DUF1345 domain-containing protein [Propioniciclava sp.]
MDDATPEQPPVEAPAPRAKGAWLAPDGRRGWVSVVVALIPQLAVTLWANMTAGADAERAQVLGFTLMLVFFYAAYLGLTWWVFGRLDPHRLRDTIRASNSAHVRRFDRLSGMDATSWVLGSVGTSLVVVAYTLLEAETRKDPLALVLTGLMVLLAWAVMQISAAVLLLRLDAESPALTFPDEGPHGLPDYTYVATQVLTTFATSDVTVTSTAGRRAITTLAIAAMVFNTFVLALLVAAFLGLTS